MPTHTHVLMSGPSGVGSFYETNEYHASEVEGDIYSDDVVNIGLGLSAN